MKQDLRRSLRVSREFPVTYVPLSDILSSDNNGRPAVLCDISAGGLAFEARDKCEKGDQLLLTISFAGWKRDGAGIVACSRDEQCLSLSIIAEVLRQTKVPDKSPDLIRVAGRFVGRVW